MTKTFSETSSDPYFKHYYLVHFLDGRTIHFSDYELMRSWWMKHAHQGVFSHVTVHDVKKRKEIKGFG